MLTCRGGKREKDAEKGEAPIYVSETASKRSKEGSDTKNVIFRRGRAKFFTLGQGSAGGKKTNTIMRGAENEKKGEELGNEEGSEG